MKFGIAEEDRELVPLLFGAVAITGVVVAHLIRFSREQKKIREQIRKDAAEEIASIRLEREIMEDHMNVAKHRHRARINEILDPLRNDGLIDF